MAPQSSDLLSTAFSDPLRCVIVDRLREGPATAAALFPIHPQSRLRVMAQIEVLIGCGLITVEQRDGEAWNHLNAAALNHPASRWLPPAQAHWAEQISRLRHFVEEECSMNHPSPVALDIRQETEFNASPDMVFNALTRDVQNWWIMRQTNPGSSITLLPMVGASLIERSPDGHEVVWGTLEEVRRPDRLYFSGRFAVKGAVAGRVHFDLEDTARGGCRLILSHQAIGNISAETCNSFNAGWGKLIGQCLTAYLLRAA